MEKPGKTGMIVVTSQKLSSIWLVFQGNKRGTESLCFFPKRNISYLKIGVTKIWVR